MTTIKIAFTGHRHLSSAQVVSYLNKLYQDYPDAIWITGGAVGLDTEAALYAMKHAIPLWLILPFPPLVMSKFWKDHQKTALRDTWAYAEKTSVLAPAYDVSVYQRRNERMVDLSDMVAAFWDGSSGGTGNCVRYALKVGKKMVRFSDFSGVSHRRRVHPLPLLLLIEKSMAISSNWRIRISEVLENQQLQQNPPAAQQSAKLPDGKLDGFKLCESMKFYQYKYVSNITF